MTNRRSALVSASGLTAAALLTSGCAVFSPVQTDVNYLPGDGTQLEMPGLGLRNLVVITDELGAPGVLVGQAVNLGDVPIQVTFAVEGSSTPAAATVPAFAATPITQTPTRVDIDSVPAAPGGMVTMVIATREAGQNLVQVPVLRAEGQYDGLLDQQ